MLSGRARGPGPAAALAARVASVREDGVARRALHAIEATRRRAFGRHARIAGATAARARRGRALTRATAGALLAEAARRCRAALALAHAGAHIGRSGRAEGARRAACATRLQRRDRAQVSLTAPRARHRIADAEPAEAALPCEARGARPAGACAGGRARVGGHVARHARLSRRATRAELFGRRARAPCAAPALASHGAPRADTVVARLFAGARRARFPRAAAGVVLVARLARACLVAAPRAARGVAGAGAVLTGLTLGARRPRPTLTRARRAAVVARGRATRSAGARAGDARLVRGAGQAAAAGRARVRVADLVASAAHARRARSCVAARDVRVRERRREPARRDDRPHDEDDEPDRSEARQCGSRQKSPPTNPVAPDAEGETPAVTLIPSGRLCHPMSATVTPLATSTPPATKSAVAVVAELWPFE
jgi:hypothetical protein